MPRIMEAFTIHVQTQDFKLKLLVVSDSLIDAFMCLSLSLLILEAHTSEKRQILSTNQRY